MNFKSERLPESRAPRNLTGEPHRWLALLPLVVLFALIGWPAAGAAAAPRSTTDIDLDWRFHLGDLPAAAQSGFDDAGWRSIDLPHDFSAEGDFSPTNASCTGYLPGGVGWYRKQFSLPGSARGQRVFVEFDGVQRDSDVWINGVHLGHRPNGYISFQYDLTPHVRFGEAANVLVVRAERENVADSRWYPGTGIYRNVRLVTVNPLHLSNGGVFVTTPHITDHSADVVVNAEVRNDAPTNCAVRVAVQILSPAGQVVKESQQSHDVAVGQAFNFTLWQAVAAPQRWSLESPALYTARCRVFHGDELVDETRTTFGIRDFRFEAQQGFFLNGVNLKLKGLCMHHDAGALGAAVPTGVLERRLRLVKALGANAVRCSHNPMAPELYDLCDRLGLLVMDEAFDEWEIGKRKWVEGRNVGTAGRFGYSEDFAEWAATDCEAMVRRDRNHPSIILWSLGNEIDYPTDPYVLDVTRNVEGFARDESSPRLTRLTAVAPRLIAAVKSLDPTRPVTMALANLPASDAVGLAQMLDVAGYNYQEDLYAATHRDFPGRALLGSENGMDFDAWRTVVKNDYVAGQFLWVGFDFLGEAGRWPNHGSTAGLFDTRGFLKPAGWQRHAWWSQEPVLHLAASEGRSDRGRRRGRGAQAHWNWGETNAAVNVMAFSNCEEVELRLNGKSIGVKRIGEECLASFPVAYEPGVLEAVGRMGGQVVVRSELRTAGQPARLRIELDRLAIAASNRGVAHAIISIVDEHGMVVPEADLPIAVKVTGAGRLLAVDNGNLWDTTPLRSSTKHPRDGQLLAIVQAANGPGEVTIQASTDGLPPEVVTAKVTE